MNEQSDKDSIAQVLKAAEELVAYVRPNRMKHITEVKLTKAIDALHAAAPLPECGTITEVVGADGKGVAAPCAIDGCALMRGSAVLSASGLSDREHTALEGLVQVASAAYNALDDSEDRGEEVILTQAHYLSIAEALEQLNALPDDQPGYTMCPSAKAAWSLDRLLNGTAVSTSGDNLAASLAVKLAKAASLLTECVEGTVVDCTDWNRRTREFLQDAPRSAIQPTTTQDKV